MRETGNEASFARAKVNAKLVRSMVRLVQKAGLDYDGFRRVCARVRERLRLQRPPRTARPQPHLTEVSLRRLYQTVEHTADLRQKIVLQLLFATEIRVSELVSLEAEAVDFDNGRIFLDPDDADQNRCIVFSKQFSLLLQRHLAANRFNYNLFECSRTAGYSPRRVQQIMRACTKAAGTPGDVHPHHLRAEMRRWLAERNLPEAQIRLVDPARRNQKARPNDAAGVGHAEEHAHGSR